MNSPNSSDNWERGFQERLAKLAPGILDDPVAAFAKLDPEQQDALLRSLLTYSCWAQGYNPLTRGPEVIGLLPREWVIKNVERVLEGMGWDTDVYVARLVLSLFDGLDRKGLCKRAVERCKKSSDADVRELGVAWK